MNTTYTYWKQQLSLLPPPLELPGQNHSPLTATVATRQTISLPLPAPLTQALHQLALQHHCPLSQVLYSGLVTVFCRYTQQNTVLINWHSADPRYTSPVPLCLLIDLSSPFSDGLLQLNHELELALAHYQPRDAILAQSNSAPHAALQQFYLCEGAELPSVLPDYLLAVTLSSTANNSVCIQLYFAPERFAPDAVQRLAGHWRTLLQAACEQSATPLSHLPLLTPAEWEQQRKWQEAQPACVYRQGNIYQHIADQLQQTPTKTALIFAEQQYDFAALAQAVECVAQALLAQGVTANSLVGLFLPRTEQMVIGILGVFKAGAAYVPLDPSYPAQRLAYIAEDTQLKLLLTTETLLDCLPTAQAQVLVMEQLATVCQPPSPPVAVQADDLAYIMYTSGSTGKPKGVMVTHGNLNSYVAAMREPLELAAADAVYLHTASFGFSASVRQLLVPLCNGVPVVLASSEQRADITALFTLIQQHRITNVDFAPSYWRHCVNHLTQLTETQRAALLNNQLRLILSSAEPLWSDIAQQWQLTLRHPARCLNMYGQTETVGMVTGYRVPPAERIDSVPVSVPIGRPLANLRAYILDQHGQPVPIGVKGDLYLGGPQIAHGYLNLPDKTASTFMPDPLCATASGQLCKTGDLARFAADGCIEFIGREDNQVKIRGFRIELGEIEMELTPHPAIAQVVVLAHEQGLDDKRLVAHIIPQTPLAELSAVQQRELIQQLRTYAHAHLLPYMVPSTWYLHDTYPRLPNGKLDRCALLAVELEQLDHSEQVAPRTDTEQQLAALWHTILGRDSFSIHDNFFDLGGHSLLAAQLMAAVNAHFVCDLPALSLFGAPSIAELATLIDTAAQRNGPQLQAVSRAQALPLSATQQRLWFLDQLAPGNPVYNMIGAYELIGPLQRETLAHSLQHLIQRHEILRTAFALDANNQPYQTIADQVRIPVPCVDLQNYPAEQGLRIAQQLCQELVLHRFDLTQLPLWQVQLIQLAPEQHLLAIVMHHSISDRWSYAVFMRDLVQLYTAQTNGQAAELPPLTVQYADFAYWQQQQLQQHAFAEQEQYWQNHLAGLPPLLELPTDFSRPAQQQFAAAEVPLQLSAELTDQLKQFSRQEGVTLFMTLLAVFNVLLYRYTEQEDIVVGSPVAYRNFPSLEPLIGFFANTIVLRNNLGGLPSFRQLLQQVKQHTLAAYAHQDVPLARLVELLQPVRNTAYNPLFQVMLSVLELPPINTANKANALTAYPFTLNKSQSDFDLFLTLWEESAELRGSLSYDTALFRPETMERLLAHYQSLLETSIQQPDSPIHELSLLSIQEQRQIAAYAQALTEPEEREVFEL